MKLKRDRDMHRDKEKLRENKAKRKGETGSLAECGLLTPSFSPGVFKQCAGTLVYHPEFVKHAIPDSLVRDTDLFSLSSSNEKKNTSQHNNDHPV